MSSDYANTISYLYSRLPMFTRIGAAAYKKDLNNTLALLEALGNPHHRFKSIHIAGTNGKGSTSHMLAAVLHASGYKTGLYTSPHLYDFRERIKVSGEANLEMVSEEFVVNFTESVKPLIESIEPSFFEVTVALAFAWFAHLQVDIAVVETGLGGRLDSTNVITPELSIITNIGWDHMNLLGDTLEKIAGEKAGIIKPGIPVVVGETLPETLPVFVKKAESCGSPLIPAEQSWQILSLEPGIEQLEAVFKETQTGELLSLTSDLPGIYQQYNLRTVLTAWRTLQQQGWRIEGKTLASALCRVKPLTGLGGRWQVIGRKPWVVLDVAHNEAGIIQLLKQVEMVRAEHSLGQIHVVMGMVKDKEIDKVLSLMPATYQYYFTQAQLERALPCNELQQQATARGLTGNAFATPQQALEKAVSAAGAADLVVVCGSVFVVAEIELPAWLTG